MSLLKELRARVACAGDLGGETRKRGNVGERENNWKRGMPKRGERSEKIIRERERAYPRDKVFFHHKRGRDEKKKRKRKKGEEEGKEEEREHNHLQDGNFCCRREREREWRTLMENSIAREREREREKERDQGRESEYLSYIFILFLINFL